MSSHQPPFDWMDPSFHHRVTDEPDFVSVTSRLLYDHLAGRVGSETKLRLDGPSTETTLRHTTVSTVVVTEPAVARLASRGRGYLGARLVCLRSTVTTDPEPEDLTAEFSATLTTRLSAAVFPHDPSRRTELLPWRGWNAEPSTLYEAQARMVARQHTPEVTVHVDAHPQDVRSVVFEIARVASWDRVEPLVFGVSVTTEVDVAVNDVNVGVDLVAEWLVTEVVVDTVVPFQIPEQVPPPP